MSTRQECDAKGDPTPVMPRQNTYIGCVGQLRDADPRLIERFRLIVVPRGQQQRPM